MSIIPGSTPKDVEEKDLLEGEMGEQDGLIFEETRYTALKHLIEKNMVEFTTNLSRKEINKILRILTWVRMYKMEMRKAMKHPEIAQNVYENCNLYLAQVADFMKLKKAEKGRTFEAIIEILSADEKAAKKFGFLGVQKEDRELAE